MTSERTFHKTTYVVEVLSEEPVPYDQPLADVLRDASRGAYSAMVVEETRAVLDGPNAARELVAQNSEPAFFGLTEEGDDRG